MEAVLDPERPLVDAHHHLWDRQGNRYLPADLEADAQAHNVRHSVFVECLAAYRGGGEETLRPVGETEFVEAQASRAGDRINLAGGIISFADLQLGAAVAPVLDAHSAASPGRFRGIRHSCTWHASEEIPNSHSGAPPQLYLQDNFRAGFGELQSRGLIFEAWCYHLQIPEVASLARAFPATTIVMNHLGGPLGIGTYRGHSAEVYQVWQRGIRDLAECPNVMMKLGGMAMPINGFDWHRQSSPPGSVELAEAFSPWFHFCIEQFGVERCLFESNFPVDKVSCSYTVLWNAFKRIAGSYAVEDQDAMLHDNALRLYGLSARQ